MQLKAENIFNYKTGCGQVPMLRKLRLLAIHRSYITVFLYTLLNDKSLRLGVCLVAMIKKQNNHKSLQSNSFAYRIVK